MTAEGSIPATDAGDSRGLSLDRKTLLPGLAILALIVVPVLLWAASSGGSGNKLRIDQGVNVYGSPEIVVNVPKKMNFASEATTPNRVQLICVDSGGGTVLHTPQPWPSINRSRRPRCRRSRRAASRAPRANSRVPCGGTRGPRLAGA
jgi:hypothetical protein